MCGIFGILLTEQCNLSSSQTRRLIEQLFHISQSRGRESSGFSLKSYQHQSILVHKQALPASKLLKTPQVQYLFSQHLNNAFGKDGKLKYPISFIAHTRLVTNGLQNNNNNNQPVIRNPFIAIHNGIITNVEQIWEKYSHLERQYEVDTEVVLALLDNFFKQHNDITRSLQQVYTIIQGTANLAIHSASAPILMLATNNGSLYYIHKPDDGYFVFASERYFLSECSNLLEKHKIQHSDIQWLKPQTALLLNEKTLRCEVFSLQDQTFKWNNDNVENLAFHIVNTTPDKPVDFDEIKKIIHLNKISPLRNLLEYNIDEIKNLRRCTRCILPETFPFIEFDENGVCNYCNHYTHKRIGNPEKEQEFRQILERYRSKDGSPDCIVPFSGGRDSSFGLHYLVRELNMRPIAYTYDWGMVTDLARRNIARMCGKLGIENILVSANIQKKRHYIRLNVEAWLRNPQLGIVPLFMAGDKQFFYYVNKIKKQTGIPVDIWCTNYLENTDFKAGFCNVKPTFDKHRPDYLPLSSQLKMAWYYLKNYLANPAYLNASLIDTLFSFYAYYAEPRRHFFQLYDWVRWDEEKIIRTLRDEYDWEMSPDTSSTWRIGDGTAPFYNYIYFTVAGFSEIDTFRSNQIREGMIDRQIALELALEENRPRFESLKWYLDTIKVDFEHAIKTINKIQKLYRK